jgi:hypothetical protein
MDEKEQVDHLHEAMEAVLAVLEGVDDETVVSVANTLISRALARALWSMGETPGSAKAEECLAVMVRVVREQLPMFYGECVREGRK